MATLAIVEDFNELEQRLARLLVSFVFLVMHELTFQGAEKAFGDSVVPAIASAAHALLTTVRLQLFSERLTCILTASI